MTTSFSTSIPLNSVSQQVSPPIPSCPAGTEFLVNSVQASPDFFANGQILQLPAWGVRVNVTQKTAGGGASSKPILLYGNGPQHLSVTLPAGQPTFFSGPPDVFVQILSGPAPARFDFVVHISGYCGVAFATP